MGPVVRRRSGDLQPSVAGREPGGRGAGVRPPRRAAAAGPRPGGSRASASSVAVGLPAWDTTREVRAARSTNHCCAGLRWTDGASRVWGWTVVMIMTRLRWPAGRRCWPKLPREPVAMIDIGPFRTRPDAGCGAGPAPGRHRGRDRPDPPGQLLSGQPVHPAARRDLQPGADDLRRTGRAAAAHVRRAGSGPPATDGTPRAVASFSPELFLSVHDGMIRTAPIKGTAPRAPGAVDSPELRASTKDAAENVMIVDLMRNDLSRVCRPGTVQVDELLSVQPAPGVWHLVSTVSGRLRPGTSTADVLTATFPPGSVTGAPKIAARQGIQELEGHDRGAYTGALGLVSPCAGTELNVIIRTFEIAGRDVQLGVGGGITVDSVPIREWYECLHKAAPLVAAAGSRLDHDLDDEPGPADRRTHRSGRVRVDPGPARHDPPAGRAPGPAGPVVPGTVRTGRARRSRRTHRCRSQPAGAGPPARHPAAGPSGARAPCRSPSAAGRSGPAWRRRRCAGCRGSSAAGGTSGSTAPASRGPSGQPVRRCPTSLPRPGRS